MDSEITAALSKMDGEKLIKHVQELASPEYGGRFPNTEGEEKTMKYLVKEFTEIGATPGNRQNASFFQEVPFVEINTTLDVAETINSVGVKSAIRSLIDIAVVSKRVQPNIDILNAEVVFAGYGIVAPDYQWNDYEGLDVKGKVVVVLVNDPGYHSNDNSLFRGTTLTYYGRWTYKYEEASRQGAAACLIVHETAAAGYPWSVVLAGRDRPHVNMRPADGVNASRVGAEGWISAEYAKELFAANHIDFETIAKKAYSRSEKKSFVLPQSKMTLRFRNTFREYLSKNFLAMIEGTERKNEHVLFSAHWDHLGTKDGKVFGGACDNASGVAALIELARAFKSLPRGTSRSIVFFSATAEEQGLLGAEYYVEHPVLSNSPLRNSHAGILNVDMLNIHGVCKDIAFYGWGNCELEEYAERAAKAEGRFISADPKPSWGLYFRSDHFPFAKKGVAGLFMANGVTHISKPNDYVSKALERWVAECYHKPADRYEPSWDLDGMLADLRILGRIGYELANDANFPKVTV